MPSRKLSKKMYSKNQLRAHSRNQLKRAYETNQPSRMQMRNPHKRNQLKMKRNINQAKGNNKVLLSDVYYYY
uniref:Uncharacterized protein n=1 Tax=Arion vulgaris TaxID=1028688 RepID=A0A0B6YKN0_9EUPU